MKNCGIFCIFFLVCAHTSVSGSTTSYDCARALTLEQEKLDEQLFNAVNKRKPNLDQIKHIINQGANVNAKFNNSQNTLTHIVQNVSALILLAENGLNIESVNKWGENRLHYAARKNTSLELIQAFIDLSDEIDVLLDQRRSFDDATPLMALAISGQSKQELEKMQLLIDNGSSVNTTFKDGLTVLHKMVMSEYWKTAKLFVENGADVTLAAHIKIQGVLSDDVRHMMPIDLYNYYNPPFALGLLGFGRKSKVNKLLKPNLFTH